MASYQVNDPKSFASVMKSIEDKLAFSVERMGENVARSIMDCAIDCLSRAVPRAPIESGDLRNSASVKIDGVEEIARGNPDGSISQNGGYGRSKGDVGEFSARVGFDSIYARKQHEDMSLRHDRTDGYRRKDGTTVNMVAGGQAKYLESVVVENIDRYNDKIKQAAVEGWKK